MRTPTSTILPLVFSRSTMPPPSNRGTRPGDSADVLVDESGQVLDVVCVPGAPKLPKLELGAVEAPSPGSAPRAHAKA